MNLYCNERLISRRVACATDRLGRGKGLIGRRDLSEEEGLLMPLPAYQQGKAHLWVAIHMLFVPVPLAVAWLDQEGNIVHALLARPWGVYYSTPHPAWYTLELHASRLPYLTPGARIHWEEG